MNEYNIDANLDASDNFNQGNEDIVSYHKFKDSDPGPYFKRNLITS